MVEGEHFDEGDLVQLNSGGPVMSVQAVAGAHATCMWFDASGTLHEQTFALGSLKRHQRDTTPERPTPGSSRPR